MKKREVLLSDNEIEESSESNTAKGIRFLDENNIKSSENNNKPISDESTTGNQNTEGQSAISKSQKRNAFISNDKHGDFNFRVNQSTDSSTINEHYFSDEDDLSQVEKLWGYCDVASSDVKLLLPDSALNLFYMPMYKGPKYSKTPQQIEREKRRLDIVVQRDISDKNEGNTNHRAISEISMLNTKEKAVEHKLTYQYRNNPELLKELVKKVMKQRYKKRTILEKKRKEREDLIEDGPLSLSPDRFQRATLRRTTMINKKIAVAVEQEQQWQSVIQSKDKSNQHSKSVDYRKEKLLTIIALLNRVHCMCQFVQTSRDLKNQNVSRWNAVKCIQKAFRQHLSHINFKPKSGAVIARRMTLMDMLRQQMGSEHAELYRKRVHSSNLIINFLRSIGKTAKSIVTSFIRKIKLIQRRFRLHRMVNTSRVEQLTELMEIFFPVIMINAQFILAGKGDDLHNMSSTDMSRMNDAMKSYRWYKVSTDMESATFHAFLRNYGPSLRLISNFFGPAARLHVYDISYIRRRICLQLLFKNRYEFISKVNSIKYIAFQTKKFDPSEVKQFIQGGEDPLKKHLLELKEQQDVVYEEYYEKLMSFRKNQINKRYRWADNFFPFLTTLKAEELAMLYIKIAEDATMMIAAMKGKNTDLNNNPRQRRQRAIQNIPVNNDNNNDTTVSNNNKPGDVPKNMIHNVNKMNPTGELSAIEQMQIALNGNTANSAYGHLFANKNLGNNNRRASSIKPGLINNTAGNTMNINAVMANIANLPPPSTVARRMSALNMAISKMASSLTTAPNRLTNNNKPSTQSQLDTISSLGNIPELQYKGNKSSSGKRDSILASRRNSTMAPFKSPLEKIDDGNASTMRPPETTKSSLVNKSPRRTFIKT